MTKIIYSSHLKFRLRFRKIPYDLPLEIYKNSKEHYFDSATNKNICVKEIKLRGKIREIALSYEKIGNRIILVTIHPLKLLQKSNRIKAGRWKII